MNKELIKAAILLGETTLRYPEGINKLEQTLNVPRFHTHDGWRDYIPAKARDTWYDLSLDTRFVLFLAARIQQSTEERR